MFSKSVALPEMNSIFFKIFSSPTKIQVENDFSYLILIYRKNINSGSRLLLRNRIAQMTKVVMKIKYTTVN